jgi:hypothetical protein
LVLVLVLGSQQKGVEVRQPIFSATGGVGEALQQEFEGEELALA